MVAVRRQLKRQMRGFPAAPCCVDPRFKLKALAPSAPAQPSIADLARGLVNLGNAGMLALSSTRCVSPVLSCLLSVLDDEHSSFAVTCFLSVQVV